MSASTSTESIRTCTPRVSDATTKPTSNNAPAAAPTCTCTTTNTARFSSPTLIWNETTAAQATELSLSKPTTDMKLPRAEKARVSKAHLGATILTCTKSGASSLNLSHRPRKEISNRETCCVMAKTSVNTSTTAIRNLQASRLEPSKRPLQGLTRCRRDSNKESFQTETTATKSTNIAIATSGQTECAAQRTRPQKVSQTKPSSHPQSSLEKGHGNIRTTIVDRTTVWITSPG